MLKKLIARILVLALLVQCVPAEAVAEAGNSLLLSQQELDRLSAEYALDVSEEYHDGMAYSDQFTLEQVVGYLHYLLYSQIDPLSNTVEMLIAAIAKVGPQPDVEQYKLRTLDAFMFNLHKIKDEVTGCIDALEQASADIQDAAACVWDTEYYSYAQRAGYSSRAKKAQDRIAATRAEVSQNHASWEQSLENSEQAIRNDGTMDVHISAANDGSFVTFTPRGEGVQGARSGEWQLRDLYAELKSSSAPQFFTVSTTDLGLKSAPSLLQRLSPITTAYADRDQDATVTILDDNQFAVEARDENGAPIAGMTVRAIDADKMYEDGPHAFVEAVTGANGAAVFDIPGNFTLDFMDKLNLYIEYPAGTGTLVRGAQGEEQPGHQSAYLWNVYIDRGTSYQHHLARDVGEPYIASVCYNSQDVTQSFATFYYTAGSNLTHRCFVKIGNADTDTGTVRLRYTSAEEKDGEGKYTVVKETSAGALTASEDGFATAEISGPFGHMFLPGQTVYLVYEDAAHAGENALVQALNVKIEAGQLPSPYSGTTKPLDINTSMLFNCALPIDLNIIPGVTHAAPSLGLDMPFNIPRLSISFTPRGSIAVSLGIDLPGDYGGLRWNKKWPEPPAEDPPVESTEGGPQRPTEINSETGGEKHDKLWHALMGKAFNNWGEKLQNLRDFGQKDKALKYPGTVLSNSISFELLGAFAGTIQNLGEDPEKGTLSVLNANASVGGEILDSGEFCAQGTLFFAGFSWTIEVIGLFTWGLAQDLYWKTNDDISSTANDYELVGSMRNVSSNNVVNIYIKIQIDGFLGFGIHGFVEASLHGYIYLACNVAIYINGTDKVDPPYKLKNPHLTLSFGGGLYILLKLILLRVRFDLLPKEYERDIIFHSNWPHEIDLDVAGWQKDWEKQLEEEAGMTAKSSTANPALKAARAEQAEADEAESQDVSSIPAVYNPDLLIDTENSDDNAVLKGLQTLNGKVAYARISGGKYRNQDDMAIHTYAFFLMPDEVGRPRLSYIDLDAETPTVYNFDAEPDASQFVDWDRLKNKHSSDDPDGEFEPEVNKRAEQNNTRAHDPEMYDYDFAVASVADNNKHVDGGGHDEAPLDGMSAVVCVLSSSELVDAEVELGSGQRTAVSQPGGTLYATSFVATRIDAKTGKLSMVISRIGGPPYGNDYYYTTDLQCSKQVITGLTTSAETAPESFTNPEITAAYKNVTFGESPMGYKVNANVYEAIVTFRPDSDRNNNYTYDRHVLRYRSYVGQEMWLSTLLEDTYRYESDSAAKQALARDRLTQFRLCDVYQPQENWKKQDSSGNAVSMALGPTVSFSVLPFEVDTSGFQDMWLNTEDFGPQVSWLEMRRFEESDEMQFYRFYESKENAIPSDYAGWPLGAVEWVPLNPTSLDTLIDRKGLGIVGHITPWNADPETEEAFFFYADEEGQSYLDSLRLTDGVLTDYGISVPAADVGCVDAGESIIFYWPTTQTPVELENGETGPSFSIKTMVYEKNSGVLFAPVSIAEIAAGRDTPPSKTFMTEEGMCYFALTRTSVESDSETGVSTGTGSTTLDFYKFEPQYTMGVEFLSADFVDGAVRPGAYDDIMMLMRNNGNVPISGLLLEVYDVDKDGNEALMETIDIDLIDPEDSTVTYTGLADGNARTETGEKVVSVTGNGKARRRGEWAVMEATPVYPGGGAPSANALPTGWDTESTYLTTKSLIPLDTTSLQAPILIGANWKGTHTIRFKIKQLRSTNAWAVDLEGNEMRAARNAARNGANALRDTREVAITRLDNGLTALHYADEEPQTGGLSLLDTLLGREAPSAPPHYNASIAFDEIDLDTDAEELTLDMRHYIRPTDGMEMVQLTAHNAAHEDDEPKCVVLYAYGDYSYDDAWFVCDFGDLNAGESYTVTLPLDAIVARHNVNTLLLDLHIDHDEARKHGTATTLNHSHDGSEIANGCIHDVNVFNDYVEIKLDDDILQIVKQPADFSTVTGGTASFSVSVRGGSVPYTYQWQVRKPLYDKDGKHLLDETGNWKYGDWADWMEGDEITLETLASADMNGWQFHVIVTDMYGRSVTSAFATLRLTDVPMTGDDAQPVLWAALALAALLTAFLVLATRRKRKTAERA